MVVAGRESEAKFGEGGDAGGEGVGAEEFSMNQTAADDDNGGGGPPEKNEGYYIRLTEYSNTVKFVKRMAWACGCDLVVRESESGHRPASG
ncbi:hypothetical protein ACFX2J_034948 [Malus domestica]